MISTGIDKIAFYTPPYRLDLAELAVRRSVPVEKYHRGIGQYQMGVPSPDEDIVTMGATAMHALLSSEIDPKTIDALLFATESGIDQAKSAGLYLHRLLNLSPHCRVIELKQACYSATMAVRMACGLIAQRPTQKIVIVAADISRYGIYSKGEASQGAGAVALLITANPRLLQLEPEAGYYAEEIMDFWRPLYHDVAFVDGQYSVDRYLHALFASWAHYQLDSNRNFSDHHHFLYHAPFPRLVEKAHQALLRHEKIDVSEEAIKESLHAQLIYPRQIGNTYTASLWITLYSLLAHGTLTAGQRLSCFSYGSGCVAELFSLILQPGYEERLDISRHQSLIQNRQPLSVDEYEHFFSYRLPTDGSCLEIPHYHRGLFRLAGIENHRRLYHKSNLSSELTLDSSTS